MKVTAKATRSGDWWAIEVPEVPGAFTQAKRLDQVAAMVRDAVSLLEDVDQDSVEVDVDPVLDDATAEELAAARGKREQAALLERQASESITNLAHRMTKAGLTLRDIGVVLGVSHQRVGQLVSPPAPAGKSLAKAATISDRDTKGRKTSVTRSTKSGRLVHVSNAAKSRVAN